MFLSIYDEYHKNDSVVLAKELNQEIESVVIVLNKRRKLQFDGFDDFWFPASVPKRYIAKNMRFHSEVIKFNDNGSVYDINIYAMYEGSDFRQELILVLQIFYREKKDHRVLFMWT